jgi:hypothetical protein
MRPVLVKVAVGIVLVLSAAAMVDARRPQYMPTTDPGFTARAPAWAGDPGFAQVAPPWPGDPGLFVTLPEATPATSIAPAR